MIGPIIYRVAVIEIYLHSKNTHNDENAVRLSWDPPEDVELWSVTTDSFVAIDGKIYDIDLPIMLSDLKRDNYTGSYEAFGAHHYCNNNDSKYLYNDKELIAAVATDKEDCDTVNINVTLAINSAIDYYIIKSGKNVASLKVVDDRAITYYDRREIRKVNHRYLNPFGIDTKTKTTF